MTLFYIILWTLVVLVIFSYGILSVLLRDYFSTIKLVEKDYFTTCYGLSTLAQNQLVKSTKRAIKETLRDQSILLLIPAVIFVILPFSFSITLSAICVGMAILDYCHYKSINA